MESYWVYCKNITSCKTGSKQEKGYVVLPSRTFPLLFASLNLLQTTAQCVFSVMPAMWMAYAHISMSNHGAGRLEVCSVW